MCDFEPIQLFERKVNFFYNGNRGLLLAVAKKIDMQIKVHASMKENFLD